MTSVSGLIPHRVNLEIRSDGVFLMQSRYQLGPVAAKTGEWLHHWAETTPDQIFIAERSQDGGWRELNYRVTLENTRALAAGLLRQGLKSGDRLAVLSGSGVDHGLLALATQYVGIVLVPVAEQYSLIPEARDRLIYILNKTKPAMIYVSSAQQYAAAINLPEIGPIPVLTSDAGNAGRKIIGFDSLLTGPVGDDVDTAYKAVGPDTLAKILFTSGSTSNPKGVCTTQRMMCVNQAQLATCLPFLKSHPPKIVDWLPWNHVFGGSHNFNTILANGGSLYVDDGKPSGNLFARTLENLDDHTGTIAYNVPIGWSMLAQALARDAALRHRFFQELDMIFYAGAALPQDIWVQLRQLAEAEGLEPPLMTTSWGMTETAPSTLIQHEPIDRSGVIGVPVPGAVIKLVADADMRCELRVKGPNVMTAYYDDPARSAESFDEEGFLFTGDAVRFLDPDDPNKGLVFDGRITEDFKLMSGTWVHATTIRVHALSALGSLAQDLVISGQGRAEIGLLIFPNLETLAENDWATEDDNGALVSADLSREIVARLTELAESATGSSTKITRALVMAEMPSVRAHEITAKGNLNIARVLSERSLLVERLYDDNDPAVIRI
ncbi:MAG: feruloyl-CoA synthase [Rhodobacteraceae bacterium]|nr:feruloyl-CoA synthase [Paracoccaceae bacterium]